MGTSQDDTADWAAMYEDFITKNLDPTRESPYTLQDLAKTWGMGYGTVRNRAGKEEWRAKLKSEREKIAHLAVAETRDRLATHEADVRERQGRMLEQLEGILWNHFVEKGGIDVDKLTEKQRIDVFLELQEARRKALGFGAVSQVAFDINVGDQSTIRFRWTPEMDKSFDKFLEEEDIEVIDVTPEKPDAEKPAGAVELPEGDLPAGG